LAGKGELKRVGVHGKGEIGLDRLLEKLKASERFGEVGGIGVFIGVTRSTSADGKPVSHLEFEAYEGKAEEAMSVIADEISNRSGIAEVLIHHVTGKLNKGDLIMAVAVAGRSRKDVFPALIEAVERTKDTVPIWKKEVLTSGESYWVSEGKHTVKQEKNKT
jgi:molybdopterin synthase catalytic subunit